MLPKAIIRHWIRQVYSCQIIVPEYEPPPIEDREIDFQELKQRAYPHLLRILEHWYPDGRLTGNEFQIGDAMGSAGKSLKFNIDKGVGADFAADGDGWGGGDIISLNQARLAAATGSVCFPNEAAIDLYKLLDRWKPASPSPRSEPITAPARMSPVPEEHELNSQTWAFYLSRWRKTVTSDLVGRWEYRDEERQLLQYVIRWDTPVMGQQVKNIRAVVFNYERMEWQLKQRPAPRPLYGLDRLAARRDATVLVVEGEKTADAAAKLFPDLVVVSWCGGAKNVGKANWLPLAGRNVVLWADFDAPGQNAMEQLEKQLRLVNVSSVRTVRLPEGLPEGWDLADPIPPGVDIRAILQSSSEDSKESSPTASCSSTKKDSIASSKEASLEEALEAMNQEHFTAKETGRTFVYNIEKDVIFGHDRFKLTTSSFADHRNFYLNRQYKVGHQKVSLEDHWLKWSGRRSYRGIVFEPSRTLEGYFNLWRGFRVSSHPGNWKRFEDHVFENICQKNDTLLNYLWNWVARMIQRPGEPGQVAIVLGGDQGTGKGFFARTLGSLFGQHFLHISTPGHLSGRFNAHQRDVILLFADEAFWAGDKQAEGTLKRLITEPTLMIEAKGKDPIPVPNMIHLIMASNEKWIVPADWGARRFFVLNVGNKHASDADYFEAIDRELNDGGYSALLHDMQSRNLEGFEPGRIPHTDALDQQKLLSMRKCDSWWWRKLEFGKLIDATTGPGEVGDWISQGITCQTDILYGDYIAAMREMQEHYPMNPNVFGVFLKDLFKDWGARNRITDALPRKKRDSRERKTFYHFPPLSDCRKAFEMYTKMTWEWPCDEEPPI